LLDETRYTQPVLFALQCALARLWMSWGIQPSAVMGHSVGEYAAACVAGVFSLEDGLELMAARGRLAQTLPDNGTMVAVMASETAVAQHIEPFSDAVSVAAINGPRQVVIAGARNAIDEIVDRLTGEGIRTRVLPVSKAFHSPLVDSMLTDLQHACKDMQFGDPRIPIVSNVSGGWFGKDTVTSDYWCRHLRMPVRFVDGMRTLQADGLNAFLEIGPKPTLLALGRACFSDGDYLWAPSLREGRADWKQMLESLGALYVRGANVDWREFDRGYVRRKVSLPTYPFQRRRYWLDDAGSQIDGRAHKTRPSATTEHGEPLRDWLYEITWQPKSRLYYNGLRMPAHYLPTPSELAVRVKPQSDRVVAQQNLKRYRTLTADTDALSSAYVAEALDSLGFGFTAGSRFSTDELADRLGIRRQHIRMLNRMLEMLAEDGMFTFDGSEWHVRQDLKCSDAADDRWSRLSGQFTECKAELDLLHQCGRALPDVLTGRTGPLHVLFPRGSTTLVERLYRDSPFARVLNALVAETITRAVEDLPPDRILRVLELGAGTGGTTSQIVPCLPGDRTEYVFTDVTDWFVHLAEHKFKDYPFVRFGTLDIERGPEEQGYAPHQFDVVVAANVLHATRDLRETLSHVKQLLAPLGSLIMLEGVKPQRWLDLVFGMTEGWWRFTDYDLRASYPLLSRTGWLKLLREVGFCTAVALPETGACDEGDASARLVFVAQTARFERDPIQLGPPSEASGDIKGPWLICADRQGVGDQVAMQFAARGHECVVVRAGERFVRTGASEFEFRPNDRGLWRRLIQDTWPDGFASCCGIVHLWSLDVTSSDALTSADVNAALTLGCESVLVLLQQVAESQWTATPRL